MNNQEKIRKAEKKRSELIEALLAEQEMIPGSFGCVYLKCGKSNCWCNAPDQRGHAVNRITWTEGGVSKTKCISKEKVVLTQELSQNYKRFRKCFRKIKKLEQKLKQLLSKYEQQIIKRTKKRRSLL